MITNADITLYNRHIENDIDVWYKTQIKNVHLYSDNKINLSTDGLKGASIFKIRVPVSSFPKKYISKEEYQEQKDVSDVFTVQNDDWIYLGLSNDDIKKPSDIATPKIMINSYSINLVGSLPHIRISGG